MQGDSGGPLVYKRKKKKRTVIGILSKAATLCNDNEKPTVYTRVTAYLSAIWSIIEAVNDSDQNKVHHIQNDWHKYSRNWLKCSKKRLNKTSAEYNSVLVSM